MKRTETIMCLLIALLAISAWLYEGVRIVTNQGVPTLDRIGVGAVIVLVFSAGVLSAINRWRHR
jgi:hypothetical protein